MPTTRRYKTHSRRAAYPGWVRKALETGCCDHDLSIGLYALRHGLAEIVVARNREPGGALDPTVVRTILREFGDVLLDDIDDTWLRDNGFLEPGQ